MERNEDDEEMVRRLRRMNKEDSAQHPEDSQYIEVQSGGRGCALILLALAGIPVAVWEGIRLIVS